MSRLGWLLIALFGWSQTLAQAVMPEPFTARYDVSYRGIGAGSLVFSLRRAEPPGHYIYETHARPSFLARMVVSAAARERSEMRIDAVGVHPLRWELDDGKSGEGDDGQLVFDWQAGTVTGRVEGKDIELATEPGLQDRLSIQIAAMTALLRGSEPGTVPMIDDERIKHYSYTRKQTANLDTALGRVETVLYESTRSGSSRVSRFWFAPSLGYLPVRAEQVRKGKVETVMVIASLER